MILYKSIGYRASLHNNYYATLTAEKVINKLSTFQATCRGEPTVKIKIITIHPPLATFPGMELTNGKE